MVVLVCGWYSFRLGDSEEGVQFKKGIVCSDMWIIGEKMLFLGWKSDYISVNDVKVEFELEYSLGKYVRFVCDIKSQDGIEVSYQLMVEMVVFQEWVLVNKFFLVIYIGVGCILCMYFGIILMECGGIGISWDNEVLFIY